MNDIHKDNSVIYSVGHSNHSIETFMSLLDVHKIEALVDVRSHPYSKHAPYFGLSSLSQELKVRGINYLYFGRELGGRPDKEELYDDNGYVLYSDWARSPLFLEGIERLEHGVVTYRIAMMCSEESPSQCDRHLLIAPVLAHRGIQVAHIRGDGTIQYEADLRRDEHQPSLFVSSEGVVWKSLRSVSRRRLQRNSS